MEHQLRSGRFGVRWLAGAALGGLLLAAPAGLTGCGDERGGTPGHGSAGQTAGADAEWRWLQESRKALAGRREQLAQVPAPGKPAPPERAPLEKDVMARSEELSHRLIDFINANPPAEGEKPAGRLLEALRMKSDEDIVLAHQFIEQGGDYRRAIEIYEAALAIDPDNPRLKGELAEARAHRYMTAERFAQIKKGMTQDEVRALLGQPNVRDVRDFPERGVTAWFYAKDADGRAAAVWFSRENPEKAAGVVYRADFNAVELPRGGAA
jgi:tetratricopeptide (TPR) repeat protein